MIDALTREIEEALRAPIPQWMLDFWEENPGVLAYFVKIPDGASE